MTASQTGVSVAGTPPVVAGSSHVCCHCKPCSGYVQYLCYFMHRLLDFRHPEIQSLASLAGCSSCRGCSSAAFEAPAGGSYLSPFWYVRLPSESSVTAIAQRSLLVKVHIFSFEFCLFQHSMITRVALHFKGFLEVWGEGATWNELIASVKAFPKSQIECWSSPDISFKIVVDGWGKAIKQEQQLSIIHLFNFLGLQVLVASCFIAWPQWQRSLNATQHICIAGPHKNEVSRPDTPSHHSRLIRQQWSSQ